MDILYFGHIKKDFSNVYEKNLLEAFYEDGNSIKVISINKAKCKNTVNKNIKTLVCLRKPIIDGALRFFNAIILGVSWCFHSNGKKRFILMVSAPLEITLACIILQKVFKIKAVHIIFDTAMAAAKPRRLIDKYILWCYRINEKLYRFSSGFIALNNNVFDYLGLSEKPCLLSRIGHNIKEENCMKKHSYEGDGSEKTIVYTGSLIEYDGTAELLEAMTLLSPDKYKLHLYGYGPMKELAEIYSKKYDNIIFKGFVDNSKMMSVMSKADLLINPRKKNKYTDIFGFPSKIIEYLLSGTPVLTTRFAAMPKEYEDFVYIMEDESPCGIAKSIENVFQCKKEEINDKVAKAYNYIYAHNKYSQIVTEIIDFIEERIS